MSHKLQLDAPPPALEILTVRFHQALDAERVAYAALQAATDIAERAEARRLNCAEESRAAALATTDALNEWRQAHGLRTLYSAPYHR